MRFRPSLVSALVARCARANAASRPHHRDNTFNANECSLLKNEITDEVVKEGLKCEEAAPADDTDEDAGETGRRDRRGPALKKLKVKGQASEEAAPAGAARRDRALVSACDADPAWHPLYVHGWSAGRCGLTVDCHSPSYPTELACCKGSYPGQISGFCLSQLPNPPTTAPTSEGGLDVYYPDWSRPFPEGYCINDRPAPPHGSRPFYATVLECCKEAYAGQMSGKCLSMLPNPPTGAPTGSGGLDVWYAIVSVPFREGYCSNERPLPVYGVALYDSQLECCNGHYAGQGSGKCLSLLPNPPTSSPTGAGGLDVYYPDYTLPFAAGVCINRAPLPNGRISYDTKELCCASAYAGQSSRACTCDAAPAFGCPGVLAFVSRTLTGTLVLPPEFDLPTNQAERLAMVPVLEALIGDAVLDRMGLAVDVTVVAIGGVPVRRNLRGDGEARRRLADASFDYVIEYRHGYDALEDDFDDAADAVQDAIDDAVGSAAFLAAVAESLADLPGNPLGYSVETDVVIVGAGAAGMSAAATLAGAGGTARSVTILEATDRVGGRVRTGTLGATKVELGAEEHYAANKANKALREEYGDGMFHPNFGIGEDVWMLDDKACYEGNSSTTLDDCMYEPDFERYDRIWDTYWRKHWRATAEGVSFEDKVATLRRSGYPNPASPTWHLYENHFAGEYATTTGKLGAKALAVSALWWPLGGTISVNTNPEVGYEDGLYEVLWKETLDKNSVTLKKESPVTNIDSSDSSFVKVTDLNGKIYKAKHVIVTASLAVLQAGKISFTPALPAATENAIGNIGMDGGMKIFMKFDKDWWTEAAGGPVARMVVKGPAAQCWPSYKTGGIDHIMICFSMSKNAELMKEGANGDADIIEKALSDLDALFPSQEGGKIATNNYSGDGKVMDWGEEEYVRGAYSYPSVKSFEGNNGYGPYHGNARVTLREPVANGRVSFAGEATSVTMYATVPGAVDEGERVARKVLGAIETFPTYYPTYTPYPTTTFPTTYPPTNPPSITPSPVPPTPKPVPLPA